MLALVEVLAYRPQCKMEMGCSSNIVAEFLFLFHFHFVVLQGKLLASLETKSGSLLVLGNFNLLIK